MPLPAALNEFAVVTAPGVEIRCYDTGGSGPTVVILHGLAGSAREFFPTAAAVPGFRTLLMDLRGRGVSTRHPGDLSRAAYVADVVRVIKEAAGRPVALV
jgi:pimeloyl-ACP methyl ester carboxylesterase